MNHVIILINNRTTPAPLPKAPPRQSPPPTTQQNQWQHTDSFSIETLTDSLCSNFPY